MADKTNNYKFPKPEADDFYDISEYNKTMDILDDSLTEMDKKKLDKNGDAAEAVTEFEQEILRENIESGETLSVTHGKVKKWFSEMKDVAFSGQAKDVTTDAAYRFVSDTDKSTQNEKIGIGGGDISETNINSLESITTEFPVPKQGETSKVFLGKIKKFTQDFNDFKSGIITVGRLVNSGNTTLEGYALDARYGKTLFDLYTKLNSDLAKTNLAFITGVDLELSYNSTYRENGRLYIDLALRNLTAFIPDTTYYFGQLMQSPQRVRTVFARTNGNFLFSGWIDSGGYINLYNRTSQIIPAGETFQILCVVPLGP